MPAKVSSDKQTSAKTTKKKPVQPKKAKTGTFNPPAIYDKVTKQEVQLAPSAWDVFQDFLKGNFAPVEGIEVSPSHAEVKNKPKKPKPTVEESQPEEVKHEKPDHFPELSKSSRSTLNVDIIWSGIALGCLIGAIYFLFGGLQPLILQNYIANAKDNIDEVGVTFIQQVNSLSAAQTGIVQNTSYNILADCSKEQKYTNLEEGISRVEVADRNLFPNQEYRQIDSFNGFSETEVRETYEDFFNYYSENLLNLQNTVLEDIRDLPTYANYRNNWIDGCIIITKAAASNSEVRSYCQDIKTKTEEYLQNQQPGFWSEIEKPIADNLALCDRLVSGQVRSFLSWKVEWLSNYGKITSFVPDIQNNIDRINRATQDMQAESRQYKSKINKIYDRKTSITGIWYILEF